MVTFCHLSGVGRVIVMGESYTQECTAHYGGGDVVCRVCGRNAGPGRLCLTCLRGVPQFGPGYLDRGERAARAYRFERDTLAGMHAYGHSYDGQAETVVTLRTLMRAYGFGLDDERPAVTRPAGM